MSPTTHSQSADGGRAEIMPHPFLADTLVFSFGDGFLRRQLTCDAASAGERLALLLQDGVSVKVRGLPIGVARWFWSALWVVGCGVLITGAWLRWASPFVQILAAVGPALALSVGLSRSRSHTIGLATEVVTTPRCLKVMEEGRWTWIWLSPWYRPGGAPRIAALLEGVIRERSSCGTRNSAPVTPQA